MIQSSSLLTVMLGLASTLLLLSLLVQVVQELYKFMTSAKARVYSTILVDMLGPWASQLMRSPVFADIQVRSAWQFFRRQPRGILLPMDQETLTGGLERTAPPWIRETLNALRLEATLQPGKAKPPSPAWHEFLGRLRAAGRGSPGYRTAREVAEFLVRWEQLETTGAEAATVETLSDLYGPRSKSKHLDAGSMVTTFREHFLPQVITAERSFPRLDESFNYAYRRRMRRQTFVVGLLLAVAFNLPFDRLYEQAAALSAEEAVTLAERAIEAYNAAPGETDQGDVDVWLEQMKRVAQRLPRASPTDAPTDAPADAPTDVTAERAPTVQYLAGWYELREHWPDGWGWRIRFLFGCVVTAILVSFGAPFWNDLAGSLIRIKRGGAAAAATTAAAPKGSTADG